MSHELLSAQDAFNTLILWRKLLYIFDYWFCLAYGEKYHNFCEIFELLVFSYYCFYYLYLYIFQYCLLNSFFF